MVLNASKPLSAVETIAANAAMTSSDAAKSPKCDDVFSWSARCPKMDCWLEMSATVAVFLNAYTAVQPAIIVLSCTQKNVKFIPASPRWSILLFFATNSRIARCGNIVAAAATRITKDVYEMMDQLPAVDGIVWNFPTSSK